MIVPVESSEIPYDKLIQGLCRTPYYSHSTGCSNFNRRTGCPPKRLITEIFDFEKELYIISTVYPVGEFAERMRRNHPEWKESAYPVQHKKTAGYVDGIITGLRLKHIDWPEEYYPQEIKGTWVSARNWYNPRRWQETARKEHRLEIGKFNAKHPQCIVNSFPEAHGVNVTGVMYHLGIELPWQWPPAHNIKNLTYRISIGGYSMERKK